MRTQFDEQLTMLHDELIHMGALCEDAIALAVKALESGDKTFAKNILPIDAQIDQKERDIESLCLKLLLHQHPVARDLRQVSAALKMITDLERIGDQASDIGEIVDYLPPLAGHSVPIAAMAEAAKSMVTESIDAYVKQDMALAQNVIAQDDIVDRYFVEIKSDLIHLIASDAKNGEYALDLLMIAKYFERIGDHATNIAEWVVFSISGVQKEVDT